jgi:hypothetical protein
MKPAREFDPAVPSSTDTSVTSASPQSTGQQAIGALIVSAAFALPGLQSAAHAEAAPDRGAISLKYLEYKESQPDLDRIKSHSPSLWFMTPIAGVWSVDGSLTSDDVSGASPRYHTVVSGASKMHDKRTGADMHVTRYFSSGTLAVGGAYSNEHDYLSRSVSITGTVSSRDKNRTWTLGVGNAQDDINPVNQIVKDEQKRTWDVLGGVTQVLTKNDIAQINLTYAHGLGYFNDPYKFPDNRPRQRDQRTFRIGWNHHFDGVDGTTRLTYRYYNDSWKIKAHTLNLEYVQSLSGNWTVTPSLRLYTQNAAFFYKEPVYDSTLGEPYFPGYSFTQAQLGSEDQRLSGFGARTFGIKIAKQINQDWLVDFKYENYMQRNSWQAFGNKSMDLEPLTAQSIQIGITKFF